MSEGLSTEDCEAIVHDFMHCLVKHKADRDQCNQVESVINQCTQRLQAMSGVPSNTSYCADEMFDYSKCSINPNTSMCANEYKILHECKLRRRRFLFGEDLGLVRMNPQARKLW